MVVVILCFTLVWFWRRYAQWHIAARARDAAARRRIATVCQLQEYELALVTMIMAQQLVLIRVRQRRSLWMRPRSQVFFKKMVQSAIEGKRQNQQQGYIPIPPPAKAFSANAHICWRNVCYYFIETEHNIEYRSLGHLFGVRLSTVCGAVHKVCTTVVDVLRHCYIRIPTREVALKIVDSSFHIHGDFHNALAQSMDSIFLSWPQRRPNRLLQ